MKWSQVERRQPRLADLGRQRLLDPGVVLVATIRRDGTPRLSPVEPFVMDGELWLSMLGQSTKAVDLIRDPRVLVHGVVTNRDGRDGEFKVRGSARNETDSGVQRRYAEAVSQALGWKPEAGQSVSPSSGQMSWCRINPAVFESGSTVQLYQRAGQGCPPMVLISLRSGSWWKPAFSAAR
jgi:hypothetical protein